MSNRDFFLSRRVDCYIRSHPCASSGCMPVHAMSFLPGFPFPEVPLDAISTHELREATKRGFGLGKRWRSGMSTPQSVCNISNFSAPDVRFISGHGGRLLAMISKSVWYELSVWTFQMGRATGRYVNGAFGVAYSRASRSMATGSRQLRSRYLCISTSKSNIAPFQGHANRFQEEICPNFGLNHTDDLGYSLIQLYSLDTLMVPVTLTGDILALGNNVSQTLILNWRKGTHALLEHPPEDTMILQVSDL